MVSLLTLLPISMNGMGVREVGTIVFLAPLGIDEDSAKALAFLWFAVHLAVSVLGGLAYMFGHDKGVGGLSSEKGPDTLNATEIEEADRGSVDRYSHQGRTRQLDRAA